MTALEGLSSYQRIWKDIIITELLVKTFKSGSWR